MRVLIVKISSLGDIVHALPLVADIRSHFPNAQIDWVVEESFVALLNLIHGIDRIIPVALRRWKKLFPNKHIKSEVAAFYGALRQESYDAVIDCQGLLKTAVIAKMARGPVWGLANRTIDSGYEGAVRFFYDYLVSVPVKTHVVSRTRSLVARALDFEIPTTCPEFGVAIGKADTQIFHSEIFEAGAPYIVLVHATSAENKTWPEASWIELAQHLGRQGYRVFLPWGSPSEEIASQRLAKAMGDFACVLPKMDLQKIAALFDRATAVVGVDTGLVHFAIAMKRPTVILYNRDWCSDVPRTGPFWATDTAVTVGDKGYRPSVKNVQEALFQLGIFPRIKR